MNCIVLQEPFMHTAHTIDYVDALSGYKCNSNIFEASSCRGSKCTALFDPSSSSCATPSKLNITVFTNNSFGAGQASQPITIGKYKLVTCRVRCRASMSSIEYIPLPPQPIC